MTEGDRMMASSTIEWTDETWNPVSGCEKVSEGCRNCYAETIAHRFWGDRPFTEVRCHPERLDAPLHWKKPRRVFVNSMSDLFHEDVPDEFIDKVFAVMALTPQHTYQVLTKRPERMRLYCSGTDRPSKVAKAIDVLEVDIEIAVEAIRSRSRAGERTSSLANDYGISETQARNIIECRQWVVETALTWPLPNCWKGVSVEDQVTADKRIPILLRTPAAVRWISAEPLLGPVDLTAITVGHENWNALDRREAMDAEPGSPNTILDWVVLGGESGPQARSCNVHWIRSLLRQCRTANVSCFVKQLGSCVVDRNDAGFEGDTDGSWPMDTRFEQEWSEQHYQGTLGQVRLRDRKGGDPSEWPTDLRVREWPQ